MKLLTQLAAQALDAELMRVPGFSIDQLMELAGLSVACAIAAVYPVGSNVFVIAGPGNNGGDALVASRHLHHFGYYPTVYAPKLPDREPFTGLHAQVSDLGIPFAESFNPHPETGATTFDVILDGIFGFSFDSSSPIRSPFDRVIADLVETKIPVASIDIPSGWDVEKGDVRKLGLMPDLLISLTAPKMAAKFFSGEHHFLGGRFVPPHIAEKYDLQDLPPYSGTDQIVRLEPETYIDDDVERLHAENGHEL